VREPDRIAEDVTHRRAQHAGITRERQRRRGLEHELDLPLCRDQFGAQPPTDTPLLSLYDAVLDHVMPPSLLVDADRNVIDSFAGAERLLRVRRRRVSTDLLELVPDSARLAVAAALTRAAREYARVQFEGIDWALVDGTTQSIDLRVDPIEGDGKPRAYLVCIVSHAKARRAGMSKSVTRWLGPAQVDVGRSADEPAEE
jgi:PAS domain-containing protein